MRFILPVLFIVSSCAHQPVTGWNPQRNAATQKIHDETLQALANDGRVPASPVPDLSVSLRDLTRVKPGKFEVYVFPKVSGIQNKTSEMNDVYLSQPRAFEVSVIAENPCRQFIQRGLFARLKPKDIFPQTLAENVARRCAIIEVTDKRLKAIGRGTLKTNDLLSMRLFVDDTYRVHAVDSTLYETPSKNRVVRIINEENLSAFSGLSLFPVDLPSNRAKFVAGNPSEHFNSLLDGVAIHQIRNRYSRSFAPVQCEGGVTTERDDYGSMVKVGWCKGVPWPAYTENARFFSVTQPITVGGAQ
jgi:hypothetical protein